MLATEYAPFSLRKQYLEHIVLRDSGFSPGGAEQKTGDAFAAASIAMQLRGIARLKRAKQF